jgi:transcriptional regulator with XRE-family HTH domain
MVSTREKPADVWVCAQEEGRKPWWRQLSFGEAIQRTRESKGLTRDELGQAVGVTGRYIREIERREDRVPSWNKCAKLARVLELELLDVFVAAYRTRYPSQKKAILKKEAILKDSGMIGGQLRHLAPDLQTLLKELGSTELSQADARLLVQFWRQALAFVSSKRKR